MSMERRSRRRGAMDGAVIFVGVSREATTRKPSSPVGWKVEAEARAWDRKAGSGSIARSLRRRTTDGDRETFQSFGTFEADATRS